MKAEDSEISENEWLLRRIPADRLKLSPLEMSFSHTSPRDSKAKSPDSDGISLFRASCLDNALEALAGVAEDKRGGFYVIAIPVKFFRENGLTVESTFGKEGHVKGHVVIKELNTRDMEKDRNAFSSKFDPIIKKLCKNETNRIALGLELYEVIDFNELNPG